MSEKKIAKMEKVNIMDIFTNTKETWKRTKVFDIDEYFCFVSVFSGGFPFHVHDKDEFFYVLKGENNLEVMDGDSKKIKEGCCSLARAGAVIRSSTNMHTGVLVFHRKQITENKLDGARPESVVMEKSNS